LAFSAASGMGESWFLCTYYVCMNTYRTVDLFNILQSCTYCSLPYRTLWLHRLLRKFVWTVERQLHIQVSSCVWKQSFPHQQHCTQGKLHYQSFTEEWFWPEWRECSQTIWWG